MQDSVKETEQQKEPMAGELSGQGEKRGEEGKWEKRERQFLIPTQFLFLAPFQVLATSMLSNHPHILIKNVPLLHN